MKGTGAAGGIMLACALWVGPSRARMPQIVIEGDTTVAADIEIPRGTVCEVRAGATVTFGGYHSLIVKGLLLAQGTAEKPICFRGVSSGAGGAAARPQWQGVEILGKDAHAVFRHCRFEGAYRNLVWESQPLFDSCEFRGNQYALYCTRKSTAHVRNCTIHRNAYGIVADFAAPLVLDNVITDNTVGVHLRFSSRLIAGRNVIAGNRTNIQVEESAGEDRNVLSPQHLWDLMMQLY